jgi:hypothetical protein
MAILLCVGLQAQQIDIPGWSDLAVVGMAVLLGALMEPAVERS